MRSKRVSESMPEPIFRDQLIVQGRLLPSTRNALLYENCIVFTNAKGGLKGEYSLAGAYVDEVVNEKNLFAQTSATSFTLHIQEPAEDSLVLSASDHEHRQQWIEKIKEVLRKASLKDVEVHEDAERKLGVGWAHNLHRGTLQSAAFLNDLPSVRTILESDCGAIDDCDDHGRSALHLATIADNKPIIEALVLAGLEVPAPDNSAQTSVHIAAGRGHANTLRFLLCRCRIEDFDDDSLTSFTSPLFLAALSGKPRALDCVIELASFGFPVDIVDAEQGDTLVHVLSDTCYSDVMSFVLERSSVDVDRRDASGRTALHRAAASSVAVPDILSALLWKGAQPNACVIDRSERKALHLCSRGDVAETLVGLGARLDLQDASGTAASASFSPALIEKLKLARAKWQRAELVKLQKPLKSTTWTDDNASDRCEICDVRFGFFLRMHHCRRCGLLVCDACSTKRASVVSAAVAPQRVCDGCFNRLIDEVADRHFHEQQPLDSVETELLSRLSESPVEPTPLSAAEALYEHHQHVANGVDADTRLQLALRGEQLDELHDRSAAVSEQAHEFQQLSKLLVEKFK